MGHQSHSSHLRAVRTYRVYHGPLPPSSFAAPFSPLPFTLAATSFAALMPDSMAPSIYPVETVANSVPAQWITPSGLRKSSTWDITPGPNMPVGPPPIEGSLSQSFQCTLIGSII